MLLDPVIVFDWDDTLLASTDLSCYGYGIDTNEGFAPAVETELKALERSVADLLKLAIDSGPVFIVTNSEAGWVQLSARRFLPAVLPLLDHITIISARSMYERLYPNSPADWKVQAFLNMNGSFEGRTIMSFGDSYSKLAHFFPCYPFVELISRFILDAGLPRNITVAEWSNFYFTFSTFHNFLAKLVGS
jgi:hypothetical protein